MLADAKCDVSMKDCNGMTAADVAEKAKESDIIKFLKASSKFELLLICLQVPYTKVGARNLEFVSRSLSGNYCWDCFM